MFKLLKILVVSVTLTISWLSSCVAQQAHNLCRYSLSNLEENNCVNASVKALQEDFIAIAKSSNETGALSVQDHWNWCNMNNLLTFVECTFLIQPDLHFLEIKINTEIDRLMNIVDLPETEKTELAESQLTFQKRLEDSCSIGKQSNVISDWDERVVYGSEVCKRALYAQRLMFLSNQYENP